MLFMLQNCIRGQISGCEAENRWMSWICWEHGRCSTTISSRTATGMWVALCHFDGVYDTYQIHNFYLRVRDSRWVQRIWATVMSWTQTSTIVNKCSGRIPRTSLKNLNLSLSRNKETNEGSTSEQPTVLPQPQCLPRSSFLLHSASSASDC